MAAASTSPSTTRKFANTAPHYLANPIFNLALGLNPVTIGNEIQTLSEYVLFSTTKVGVRIDGYPIEFALWPCNVSIETHCNGVTNDPHEYLLAR